MICKQLIIIVILSLYHQSTLSYKIIIYSPKIGHSHVNFLGHIADTLVLAGHNVTIYSPAVSTSDSTSNGTRFANVRILLPSNGQEFVDMKRMQQRLWSLSKDNPLDNFRFLLDFVYGLGDLCKYQLEQTALLDELRAEHFDLGLTEMGDMCGLGIFQLIGVQKHIICASIGITSFHASLFGASPDVSYVPGSFATYGERMTYWQRVANLLDFSGILALNHIGAYFQRLFPANVTDIIAMVKSSAYLFVNTDEFLDFPRPINHRIIYVGGIGVESPKKLESKFEQIVSANNIDGVVLLSFGSNMDTSALPDTVKQAIFDAFAEFPTYNFIVKYEKLDDRFIENVANVHAFDWMPQVDLLNDDRVVAFISHGGMNSIIESAFSGTPLICVPLFADQFRNAQMVRNRGFGVIIDKHNMTKESLVDALKQVLFDKSYQQNAKHLAALMHKKPMTSTERIVKYTEFAAEFAPLTNLISYGNQLGYIQFFMLDIIVPFLLLGFFLIYAIIKITVIIIRRICSKRSNRNRLKID